MEKSTELNFEMHELDKKELIETNGGLVAFGLSLLALWCEYLLENDSRLVDGVTDAWNELAGTIKN